MNIFNHTKYRYLLLMPVIVVIGGLFYFMYMSREIDEVMLRQKILEITASVDMIGEAVEANSDRYWLDHEKNISGSIEFLDRKPMMYAGMFKLVDNALIRISGRNFETDFDPLVYPEFIESVKSKSNGYITLNATPTGLEPRELHMYFRWMPMYSKNRYLVVAGVSKYSIVTKISAWVSVGQWVSLGVTFILNMCLVVLICRLGYIYDQRGGGDKWRGAKPSLKPASPGR